MLMYGKRVNGEFVLQSSVTKSVISLKEIASKIGKMTVREIADLADQGKTIRNF
jgi:hypothetical protein